MLVMAFVSGIIREMAKMTFVEFCEVMYSENCVERRQLGENIIDTLSEYISKNQKFLLDKYSEMCDSDYTLTLKEIVEWS